VTLVLFIIAFLSTMRTELGRARTALQPTVKRALAP
jgi:hypothetical protein